MSSISNSKVCPGPLTLRAINMREIIRQIGKKCEEHQLYILEELNEVNRLKRSLKNRDSQEVINEHVTRLTQVGKDGQ